MPDGRRVFNRRHASVDLSRDLDRFSVQYFSGCGESLRTYNERTETVRAGFSLVRLR